MPNQALAINIDVARPAVQLGSSFISGGLQRVAWEISTPLGFITTGAMAIGGTVGSFMLDGLGGSLSEGIAASGAALTGWILTEQFLIPTAAGRRRLTPRNQIDRGGGREALEEGTRAYDGARSISELAAR